MRHQASWTRGLLLAVFVACGDGPTIWNPGNRELPGGPDAALDFPGDSQEPDSVRDASGEAVVQDAPGPETVPGEAGGGEGDSQAPDGDAEGPGDDPAKDAADGFAEGDDPDGSPETGGPDPGASDSGGGEDIQGPSDPGLPDPGVADPAGRDDGPTPAGLRIRLVAANLTSGSDQSWDPGHGIRILQGLRGDVVMVQEFNYGSNTTQDYRRFTDQACGTGCSWSVGRGQIPNGIVSRWPVVESGAWDDPNIDNRDLDWARIDLPGSKDLVVVSVHLHTSPSSDQVKAAQVVAQKVVEYRRAHPGCCWYVVGGDFNGTAAVSSSGFGAWQGEDVFHVLPPHPVGEDGSIQTNRNRSSQYDFVLLDTELVRYQVPACFEPVQGDGPDRCYPPGLVFDTRDFSQAILDAWFPPSLTSDSNASNMQHMAVVKDVVIQ